MILDASAFVAEPGLLARLWEHARMLDCSGGRRLFSQGEVPLGLFLLRSGEAAVTLGDDLGTPLLTTRIAPGSLLGLPALVGDTPNSMSGFAEKDAIVGFLSKEAFSTLMFSEPAVRLMNLRVLAAEVRAARAVMSECHGSQGLRTAAASSSMDRT